MIHILKNSKITILTFILLWVIPLFSQSLRNDRDEGNLIYERYKNRPKGNFSKISGKGDRAVGILDRGQLANVTGNFGIISNFHLFAPAFHWPSWADDSHQYCFGLELLVGYKGDVVTSVFDPGTVAENYDWEATDGSKGGLFSGNLTVSDGTPWLASSDNDKSWPLNSNGKPFWPGPYRIDPATGEQVEGEFVSERDVYGEFDDKTNVNGSYGLVVYQKSYSFSRSYAEDFIIFDFSIINTSENVLDSVWVGYMSDFKVDFDAHDHIRLDRISPRPDLIYLYDSDPNAGAWDITGYIGFLNLFWPRNMGITDFHYFDNIYEPSTNDQLWEIMTSDTSGSHITVSNYFHHLPGQNYRIDNTALSDDLDPSGQGLGTDFVFIVSTGPLTLQPHDTVRSAFTVVLGANKDEMFANAQTVKDMSNNFFLGPNAPRSPIVQAFPQDKKVLLTWDGSRSETSRDLLSEKMDFEGYKIYRSDDFGRTWGNPITDERGNLIGYVPIAQYDLDNDIFGRDPNSNFYLGSNTGLRHTFVDSTVLNGKEYWYSVTAYDRGDAATGVPALESSIGVTKDEPNVAVVIPAGPTSALVPSSIAMGDSLPPIGGECDSRLEIQVVDNTQLTGDRYQITFNDLGMVITASETANPDTAITTTFNLVNLTTGDTLLANHPLLNESGDNVPVTDGFRVLTREAEPGVKFLGWTLVSGDTCTYEWRVTNFEAQANNAQVGPVDIYSSDDFRLTVDYTNQAELFWYDIFTGETREEKTPVPLKIELINDPANPVDIDSTSWLREYDLFGTFPNRDNFFSPFGWDLEPGGKGFNPNTPVFAYLWPDIINPEWVMVDTTTGLQREFGVFLLTQNYPDQYTDQYGNPVNRPAVQPQQGDQFTIITKKLFRSLVSYEFDAPKPTYSNNAVNLNEVKVVPNPYIVRAGWEQSQFEGRLQFTNLPPVCDIIIYTTAGDRVATLRHDNNTSYEFWNLQNDSQINVAYGLYVFVVKTPDDEKYTGRFVVIK